jgi:hypothetical protein
MLAQMFIMKKKKKKLKEKAAMKMKNLIFNRRYQILAQMFIMKYKAL